MSDWLTSTEIAEYFNVTPRAVQRWIKAMKLSDKLKMNIAPGHPLGRWRYHKKVLELLKTKFQRGRK